MPGSEELGAPGARDPTAPSRPLPSPLALHQLPHWFKNLRISRQRCRELIERAVPRTSSLDFPAPPAYPPRLPLRLDRTHPQTLPHDPLARDAPEPVQAAASAVLPVPRQLGVLPSTPSLRTSDGLCAVPAGSGTHCTAVDVTRAWWMRLWPWR